MKKHSMTAHCVVEDVSDSPKSPHGLLARNVTRNLDHVLGSHIHFDFGFAGNRLAVLFQAFDIGLNSLPNVGQGLFPGFTLGMAARKCWATDDVATTFEVRL